MNWITSPLDFLFNLSEWYVSAIIGTGFFTYYLLQVVKQPILVCSDGKFKDFLSLHLPILQEKYWPTLWCFESRLQTAFANVLRSLYPKVEYWRETLKLSDGGQLALDWLEEGCPTNAPIIIILPGLTGDSQSQYIRCLALSANRMKLRIVVLNYRGLGGMSLKTPRTYNAANFEDLSEAVRHVKILNPGIPVAAVGISMGGLVLGNYLASQQTLSEKTLVAAMVISTPWNVFKAMDSLEKPVLNLMLNRYLTSGFFSFINRVKHDDMLQGPWCMEDILKCKTVREFDSSYTAKQFGYKDVSDYYANASIHDKLHKIEVPMLCLSARDDPIQPYEGIPVEEASKSKYVAIVITQYGGHIGFLEGLFPARRDEYICRLFTQYFNGIFTSGSELLAAISKSD
ncbi:phospholipase ABHD3-like isoform X2 [Zootermopsis nevadensis]|uniref:Abhydrolase domain-containing protein 3 n=1 Tax=Zootermopsis nevadensis TaxID=136037 RepID=A0A067RAZ0_ZOONE|nr:phospholipase ABHD3-like isoform X2 [Zootermopsis nevadensis]KDR20893.1 Abhydrolase domain-containing protein 3 [Zootermopsis nevadensis]